MAFLKHGVLFDLDVEWMGEAFNFSIFSVLSNFPIYQFLEGQNERVREHLDQLQSPRRAVYKEKALRNAADFLFSYRTGEKVFHAPPSCIGFGAKNGF